MARTTEGEALSERHRLAQLAIRAALLRELTRLWPLFDPTDPDSFDRFADVAATLVRSRHRDSAGLAVRYLGEFRATEGIAGVLAPILADPPSEVVTRESLRATGLVGTLNARRAGFTPDAAAQNGFVRVAGAATSLVLAGGRRTIVDSLRRDPARPRWQRITAGSACAFCRMLAGRGPAFTADAADFVAHDHCACMAEPAYEGSRLSRTSSAFRRQWEEATAGLSGDDALRAFRQLVEGRG